MKILIMNISIPSISQLNSNSIQSSLVPNNESKAGGAAATTTTERGGKNWGNDRVDRGADWLRGNKHNDDKDNKGMTVGMPQGSHQRTGAAGSGYHG